MKRKQKQNKNREGRTRKTGLISGVKCSNCGHEIFSLHRHDFVTCQCGLTHVDGGFDYLKQCWDPSIAPPKFVKRNYVKVLYTRKFEDECRNIVKLITGEK